MKRGDRKFTLARIQASLRARGRGVWRKAQKKWWWAEYRWGRPVYLWLCGQKWFQQRHQAESEPLRQFLHELGTPPQEAENILCQSLVNNIWRDKWFHAHWNNGGKLHQVTGREHLTAALAQGKGVILAQHHGIFTSLSEIWLTQNGFAPFHSVASWARGRQQDWRNPLVRIMESARDIKTAEATLQQGRIARILPDGHKGRRPVSLLFCRRRCNFQTSFAELALRTGAPILPLNLTADAQGRLTLIFEPPLLVPQAEHTEQVKSLTKQYAAYLEQQWQQHAANIPWLRLKQCLSLPPP